jgi:type IV fimbrial biogenesis protein FimT
MGGDLDKLLDHQQGRLVLNLKHPLRGMSLIELLIGLVIMGILLSLAAPSYMAWIQNTKIRTTAEGMLSGLQLARTEAVRRNTQISFTLTDTLTAACAASVSGTNWVVSFDNPAGLCDSAPMVDDPTVDIGAVAAPRMIQNRPSTDGSTGVTVVAAPQSSITFNGLGRIVPATANTFDFSIPAAGACATAGGGGGPMRCMRIQVSAGGQIRLCDPARASTDPMTC